MPAFNCYVDDQIQSAYNAYSNRDFRLGIQKRGNLFICFYLDKHGKTCKENNRVRSLLKHGTSSMRDL